MLLTGILHYFDMGETFSYPLRYTPYEFRLDRR
uniref:Uncharacterized protein n=1 Tax=Glossina morsitans morsitans TaxID=37546 RepID=A0A1B0GFK9_GLOMM